MEKPTQFGCIRKGGIRADAVYWITQQLERTDLSDELRLRYTEMLVELAKIQYKGGQKPGKGNGKKPRKKKKESSEEASNKDWGKIIGGG